MAQSGDNIKNLYDALKDEYDLGSEQDFRTSMSDKTNRQNLYNTIKDEYDLGTEADFDKAMGYDEAVKQNTAAKAAPVAQQTTPKAAQSTAPNRTAAVDATATNKEQDKQGDEGPGLLETAFGGGKVAGPEARKTTDEPEKIDELAIKYQRLMNEQNRNVADYGRYYNQALGEMDKMPQQGGTIYAPVARYQEQLIADWLQKASPAETEKYNSDPNFAQQKNWEIFNQAQQVQDEFYKRKAAEMAHNLVNKVDGGTPDEIQENLREAYFNKNNVYDINKVSNFLRMQGDENDQNPYLYYRRFIQNYYMPAIQNALKEKFKGLTLTAPGLSWDMNDLTGSEGKSYDERWMNADERDAYDTLLKLFHTDMDKLNKEGAAAFTKQYNQETAENMSLGGREGHAMQVGAGGNALRARNYAADPKKAVDDVLNKLYANSGGGNGGGNGGDDIDREAIGKLLYRNMMKYLVDRRVPQSKWGYVLQGFADSDLGEVFKTLTKTQYDRYLDKLANDKYVRNLNGFTGLLAEGGHEATKFLGDAWEYWLGGKAGNAITKAVRKRAIAGITADLTAKGIMESEARNIAVRIANARTKTAAEKAFIHSLSGAATLGSAGAISGGVQQILTPAGGAKKAEIQERRAGGEKISPEQERQEIAQANAEAHSAGAVAKSTGGAALSGGASGALFGTGALAGDMASKAASKYFGDLTSEAVGYAAKLNTNAAAATAMGQMEGAISGQQPEGSIAQQFARNVVNFAMLDGLNYAPKMLNRHPVRNYRQWKEYERSTGISEEDEARMRDAGYGDLIDTVDGLVSDRLRNRAAQSTAPNGTKDRAVAKREPGNSEKEQQETKINEGMLKLLADPRLPEELKRKYYMVVTGDTSRQLSPIVASEVSTDDDSKTRLVTYNKNGGVVSDREYRNEKAAKEAQEKIGHEQDENLTQALQQNVYAKDADSVMKEAYDAAAQVYNNDGSLNTGQRTLIYLYQHKPQLDKALQAMTSGEPLSDEDRKLVSLLNTVQGTLYKMNGTIPRIANDIEEDYGLGTDGLKAAREGHTEKEAKKISAETGEEIVHVGGDVWRTRNEDAAVKEYQRRLFDYSTNVEEGKDVEMPEPKGLPGEAEGEAAQSTAPNGTEPPTDGDQPPTDQLQQGEGQPSKVQQIRAQGRERGSSVMDDETMLDQLQYESDYANQRLDNAFPDGELSDFRDGLVKAVDDGDDDAIQTLLDKYDSRLSQEQKDAAMNYVESAGAMEGIDDTIVAKTQQYQTQRKEELDRISDHNGNITMLTLADGSKLYYISGDLTNEYGGVIATDEWGKRQQIPVSSITGVGEVQSSQAILDNDTNNYAAAVEKHFMDMANGRKMLSGQRTTINIGGEDVNAVCDGTLDDGTVVLTLDDGSKIQMSPDELSQTRAAARKASVERNLAEADNLREMQAQEERFKNGIDDYGTSSPDIGGKGTKPEVAAEYLHEQDKKNGTDSKATLKDMDQRLKTTHFNERQSKREIDYMQDLLSVADEGSENYDLYKQRIEQYTQQLAEDQRRQRKIAEVRNAYMTPKEKQQMKMERMGAIDKARKAAEEERRNVLRRTGQSEEEQVKVEGIDSKSLLGKYKTQAEADAALQQQRDTIMKDYRDGAGTAIADIQNQLREYGDGLRELDDDELSDLSSRLVEAQQQEKRAIEQAKQIKAAQQRLPLTYKDRNKEEVDKLSPREKRAHILQGARDPQDLLRRAREAYADSDMVGRLDDLEPETLEEYVSQNIGYGQFSWEGSGTGIARKRGLKEELGLKRGIGRNYDSNAINAYLAPKGQGESVDEVAHGLWEGRPSNMEQYDTQDMRNKVLELLGSGESARSIKYKTIQNRIDELESYEQAQEEQEEWYRLQAEEEELKRQIDEDTYKDYLETIHAELAPLFDTVKDFLNGLYADEIAMAEDEAHEQEEAWNEYLAEKEKQEQAAAEQRRTKTINDGTEETDGTGAVGRGRTLDKQSEPGGVQTRGSEGQAPLRGEEPDKSHAPLEDHAQQSDDRGTTAAAAGNSSADRGILVPEGAQGVRLNKDQVTSLLKNMEDNAETSTELELTPETWSAVFDENNSTNTPLGRVKMGEGQTMKFFIKGRTKEFGMVGPTLNDPDVIIEEPSEAKDGNSERASSYIFVKTFNRNGEKIKFYASVTVKKDGMEVSISSHYMNPSAVSRRILENNVIYIRKALIPNSSDGHLAEHRNGVPDLLPTQGNNAYSDAKVEKTSGSIGKKSEKVAEGERNSDNSAAAEQRPTEPSGTGSIGTTDSPEKVESERQSVNTEPTEGQKEAGNYKKGHIKVDGYDITIENPKGSTRSGKDASGKAWSVPMHYDYGYIKGTEGVDGDHIDVYLSDEPTKGNVYVVDQINQNDGTFDEHKVMYGFPSMEAAVEAYKGQYEDGWKVGTVTEVSREDFKKWVESSKRKTKPFAEYKSMEAAAKQQRTEPSVPDIKPIGSGDFGPIYDQFKGKPNDAVKFLMSQKDGEALGALHHKEIGAISIVWRNAKAGLQKIAHKHPEVLGNLQEILDGMHVVRSSDNRVKLESGTHFAVVSRDWLGKEHTPWLLTAFEKKESSANNNSMDTAETLDGKRNDTATPRDTAFNGKDSKKNNTKQEKGEKNGTTQPLTDINSVTNEIETRQYIAKYATMKAAELRKREPDELLTLERKELAQADTNEQLAKIAKGEKRDKLLNDVKAHRANAELAKRVREEKEKEAKDIWGFHRAPSRVGRLTKREIALRDALNDAVRETGIEVIEDVEEGQRVLDMANDALLSKSKKRALETASLGTSSRSLTAISSADGAKVLKGLDNLVNKCENSSTQPKTFIGEVADALGIPRENFKDKSSRYATFETKNGKIVTIRISDHNATASNLDVNGQEDAISVVVTNKPNTGITNDGDAHIVEYYYNAIKLRKAEGKPLADIVRSIKQALYSGEFNDTTGLAERQEVNAADIVREQRVYHGSGADFDAFDNSHMGEGEGVQAHGWGTYVTKSESVGKNMPSSLTRRRD